MHCDVPFSSYVCLNMFTLRNVPSFYVFLMLLKWVTIFSFIYSLKSVSFLFRTELHRLNSRHNEMLLYTHSRSVRWKLTAVSKLAICALGFYPLYNQFIEVRVFLFLSSNFHVTHHRYIDYDAFYASISILYRFFK